MRLILRIVKSKAFWVIVCLALFGVSYMYFYHSKMLCYCDELFAIKKVEFTGNRSVPSDVLLKNSAIKYGENIFSSSVESIQDNLSNLSWISSSVVHRVLPNTYRIKVQERIPIAYWQDGGKLYLFDRNGTLLDTNIPKVLPSLPITIGANAYKTAPRLFTILSKFPFVRENLVFGTYIGNRRWDLQMHGGLLIKLGEERIIWALEFIEKVYKKGGFTKNITTLDFRVHNKVIVTEKNGKKYPMEKLHEI